MPALALVHALAWAHTAHGLWDGMIYWRGRASALPQRLPESRQHTPAERDAATVTIFASVDGTLINACAVLLGGSLGALVGDRLPSRIHEALFGALGLFTVLIGEAINLERGLQRAGDWAQKTLARPGSTLSEAFVTASLIFCVGPLTILGALDNGLSGDTTKLVIKATLDGFAALAIGATLGWGVLLSIIVVLVYQGGISLLAHTIAPILNANPDAITELTATGGLILVAIGLKLLKIRDLRVANWLPALVVAPLLVAGVALVGPLLR